MYMYDPIREHLELIIGIIGVTIGLFSIVYCRKPKKLSYILKTVEVAKKQEEIPRLKISYEDKPVEILSSSEVAIFNDGSRVIHGSDISRRDPLRIITSKDFRVFDPTFSYIRNKANDFSLEEIEEGNVISISFDYMNSGDGCIIKFLHDGATSDDISVAGSLKGVQKLVRIGENRTVFREYLRNLFGLAILVIGFGIFDTILKVFYHFSTAFDYLILFSLEIIYLFLFFYQVFLRLPKTKKEFYLDRILHLSH
jgi:hypothetical protein